jgi:hypothetical protein
MRVIRLNERASEQSIADILAIVTPKEGRNVKRIEAHEVIEHHEHHDHHHYHHRTVPQTNDVVCLFVLLLISEAKVKKETRRSAARLGRRDKDTVDNAYDRWRSGARALRSLVSMASESIKNRE